MSVDDSKPEPENSKPEVDSQPDETKDDDSQSDDNKPKPKKERSPDLAKFWKAVEDDPQDFTGWFFF